MTSLQEEASCDAVEGDELTGVKVGRRNAFVFTESRTTFALIGSGSLLEIRWPHEESFRGVIFVNPAVLGDEEAYLLYPDGYRAYLVDSVGSNCGNDFNSLRCRVVEVRSDFVPAPRPSIRRERLLLRL